MSEHEKAAREPQEKQEKKKKGTIRRLIKANLATALALLLLVIAVLLWFGLLPSIFRFIF